MHQGKKKHLGSNPWRHRLDVKDKLDVRSAARWTKHQRGIICKGKWVRANHCPAGPGAKPTGLSQTFQWAKCSVTSHWIILLTLPGISWFCCLVRSGKTHSWPTLKTILLVSQNRMFAQVIVKSPKSSFHTNFHSISEAISEQPYEEPLVQCELGVIGLGTLGIKCLDWDQKSELQQFKGTLM